MSRFPIGFAATFGILAMMGSSDGDDATPVAAYLGITIGVPVGAVVGGVVGSSSRKMARVYRRRSRIDARLSKSESEDTSTRRY